MIVVFVIGMVLLTLWLLGLITSITFGGLIYLLLVIGLVLVAISVFRFIMRKK